MATTSSNVYFDPSDVLQIRRTDIEHVAVGCSLHDCRGANRTRLEGRIAPDEFVIGG